MRILRFSGEQHDSDVFHHQQHSNGRNEIDTVARRDVRASSNATELRVTTLQVPSFLADGIATIQSFCFACWQLGWELTTCRLIPSKTVLYRISVMAIAWERVLEDLCWEATHNHGSCTAAFSITTTTTTTSTPTWPLTNLLVHLSWFLPFLIFVISISHYQIVSSPTLLWPRIPHQAEEIFLVTALVSLLCLEILFPLAILGCTSLLLWHKISCTTSLAVLGGVYVVSSTTARWIRCLLYSYIGGRE